MVWVHECAGMGGSRDAHAAVGWHGAIGRGSGRGRTGRSPAFGPRPVCFVFDPPFAVFRVGEPGWAYSLMDIVKGYL